MEKLKLDDLTTAGKTVLVRVDFNVPLDGTGRQTTVADDTRIRAALPTIEKILGGGGKAVLMSHLGRPKATPDLQYSLKPVANHLQSLLEASVTFSPDTVGRIAASTVRGAPSGSVVLLENTRFLAGETSNDGGLAEQFASLGDVFVNDAFGSAHRAHASTEGVTHHVEQAAMGYLLEREVKYLGALLEKPDRPFVAILGGAKVSDKMGVIESLLPLVDRLLVGGAMSYTFLRSQGIETGSSKIEEDRVGEAGALLERASGKIVLPVDHVVATTFENNAERRVAVGGIDESWIGLDIGPGTAAKYTEVVGAAETVVWNGPMGVFEMANFAAGTQSVAAALAAATERGALTVVGGGDSVAAVTQGGFSDRVSHVSTGGGAMLELLEGKTLPGIAALSDSISP